MQSWRTTANAVEALAAICNGTLLCLDELSQADQGQAGVIIYSLGNNQGKGRADRGGQAKARKHWRTMVISSGEISLADAEKQAGKRTKAGQEVRLLDIRADGRSHGVFDDLHDHAGGAEFADALVSAASQNFGTVGPRFVAKLMKRREDVIALVRKRMERFRTEALKLKELAVANIDGQVERAITRLGIVMAAGELATQWGLTEWPAKASEEAALMALKLWLNGRGGTGASEAQQAVKRVRAFIAAYETSRFDDPASNHKVSNRAGYKVKGHFYISPDAWAEIHDGNDPERAAGNVRDAGFLRSEDAGRLRRKVPGVKDSPRYFCVSSKILAQG